MWTWTSMTPGRTMSPEASITRSAVGAFAFAPIQVIRPSLAATAQLRSDDETATLPYLITRSAELKLVDGPKLGTHYLLLYWEAASHCTSLRRTIEALTIISRVKTPIAAMSRGTCE